MQTTSKIHSISSFPTLAPQSYLRKSTIRCAHDRSTNGRDLRHSLVDESMILLRKRINETKLAERNYEAPSDWSDWEKEYYIRYGLDVFELMGFFQALLINTRPSLGLAIMGLLIISVPTSTIMVAHSMMHAWNFIFH